MLAWGITYTWGLFAPPTKVEGDQTALLQDIHKKVQQLQASSSELAKAVPVVDELEVTIKSILDEASKSPIAALLTLSSALESEAQKIIAASGWNNHEGKDFTLDQSIERLIELGQAPRVAAQTFKLFSVVRSKMGNSGNAVSDADILSAIDSGVTILRVLYAIPVEQNVVYRPAVPLYSDAVCTQVIDDVKGLVIESTSLGGTKQFFRVFATTRSDYVKGEHVTWEWNRQRIWPTFWYHDPVSNQCIMGGSMEFVGRDLNRP